MKVNFSACENAPPIMKLPVGFSVTVDVDVDLVGGALRFRRLDGHVLEVAEAVDAVARQLDRGSASYHELSNWRNSRRITSSRVMVLPEMFMWRT